MLPSSVELISQRLDDDSVVLDVGGWAKPFPRADWVIDLLPYETRGLYGELDPERERFSAESWIERDVCDREPLPFADDAIDFAICSHTLEDLRDPIWVCAELSRVAKAGYVEVPSRLEEQSYGVQGPWVGWAHHHWLIDLGSEPVEFVFKSHALHGNEACRFPAGFADLLTPSERVQTRFWEGALAATERVFIGPDGLDGYLSEFVARERGRLAHKLAPPRRARRLRDRLARLR